jgi:hypothetical protein
MNSDFRCVVPLTSKNTNCTLDSWKARRSLIARKRSVQYYGLLAISLSLSGEAILAEVVTVGF